MRVLPPDHLPFAVAAQQRGPFAREGGFSQQLADARKVSSTLAHYEHAARDRFAAALVELNQQIADVAQQPHHAGQIAELKARRTVLLEHNAHLMTLVPAQDRASPTHGQIVDQLDPARRAGAVFRYGANDALFAEPRQVVALAESVLARAFRHDAKHMVEHVNGVAVHATVVQGDKGGTLIVRVRADRTVGEAASPLDDAAAEGRGRVRRVPTRELLIVGGPFGGDGTFGLYSVSPTAPI